jgi:pilus assembly protein Flp/PilA
MTGARLHGDDGATMVEYALVVALIAVVCIASIGLLGNAAKAKFSTIGSNIGAVQ